MDYFIHGRTRVGGPKTLVGVIYALTQLQLFLLLNFVQKIARNKEKKFKKTTHNQADDTL